MKKNTRPIMSTKDLVYCALLAALSVIFARLIGFMPEENSRFSIEAVPIFLAGLFFGPVAGGMVGFTADFAGCIMFSSFGYNPAYCIPPILYGVFGGLMRHFIAGKTAQKNVGSYLFFGLRLAISLLIPVVLGSVLIQSVVFSLFIPKGTFQFSILYYLGARSVQFSITFVVDLILIYLLFTANLFRRLGLWPPAKKKQKEQ